MRAGARRVAPVEVADVGYFGREGFDEGNRGENLRAVVLVWFGKGEQVRADPLPG